MANTYNAELLKDKAVRDEIDRYKWIESEKVGHDIGFDRASREWLEKHANAWKQLHSRKKSSFVEKVKNHERSFNETQPTYGTSTTPIAEIGSKRGVFS